MRPRKGIYYNCDFCEGESYSSVSKFNRKKRHFCSTDCYSLFRKFFLPREEQHSYGSGHSIEERLRKKKCRSDFNHAVNHGKIRREPCSVCGMKNAEGHHKDYSKPLDVEWFCFYHHREIHENPELLNI